MLTNQALDQEINPVRGIDALALVSDVNAAVHVTSDGITLPTASL